MSDRGIFYDSSKCKGCRSCQAACTVRNGLPVDRDNTVPAAKKTGPSLSAETWCLMTEHDLVLDNDVQGIAFDYKRCRHCQKPNCVTVCPVDAIEVRNGWTIVHENLCIGCGECYYACPFRAISPADEESSRSGRRVLFSGKAYKCNACAPMIDDPACVRACPSGALSMDHRQALVNTARKRLNEVKKTCPYAFLYGIKEFGALKVISLYCYKKTTYKLPVHSESMKG